VASACNSMRIPVKSSILSWKSSSSREFYQSCVNRRHLVGNRAHLSLFLPLVFWVLFNGDVVERYRFDWRFWTFGKGLSSRGSRVDMYAGRPNMVEVRMLDQRVFEFLGMPGKHLVVERLTPFAHVR
jgi:hypothetical protein